jgi:nitric oxide reductase NorD protein
MVSQPELSLEQIQALLDELFEVEFTFRNTTEPTDAIKRLVPAEQRFVLDWVARISSTNIELAYQFCLKAADALRLMDESMIETWVVQAMDSYDRVGLQPALKVIRDIDIFVRQGRERASGALFDEQVGVLLPFVHGLSGRKLKLEQADFAHTDSETIYLPAVMAHLPNPRDNFQLYKATVAHLWAQTRFGTFRVDIAAELERYAAPRHALRCFHALESVRLDACVARELPGLYREMRRLQTELGDTVTDDAWQRLSAPLQAASATVADSLILLPQALALSPPSSSCFYGELAPGQVAEVMRRRIEREKARFRVALKKIDDELNEGRQERTEAPSPRTFHRLFDEERDPMVPEGFEMELAVDGNRIPLTDELKQTMTSIIQDLGDIPDEYLIPAGPGEYDLSAFEEQGLNPDDVWSGAYHEEGAFLYPEWDFRRKHYKKDWCVVRELQIQPQYDGFATQVLQKYRRLLASLRRTFEAMRDEDRLLKRQVYGDGVDIDAFVEAWADLHIGLEMSDRLFTRMQREERSIAVVFMVDMSGSTEGWINQMEREALVLLAESLQMVGDRYAIYGFTGQGRKRCELFQIKAFDEAYDAEVQARISGITAGDYTRMGAAIRHLTAKLKSVEARTKLLVTLSDGKPEDYPDHYRGEYGVEDTRQALYEARQDGVHAYCITIDEEGQDYLPHMYGAANYALISDVETLPRKVSEIYKKLTS